MHLHVGCAMWTHRAWQPRSLPAAERLRYYAQRCNAVEEFADPTLCDAILKSVSGRSFSLHRSALEIHGLCGACGAV